MDNDQHERKKLKICFIDMNYTRMGINGSNMWFTPYSTFHGYNFDKDIHTRVSERFGWSTHLEKLINSHSVELNIHVISFSFLQNQGVIQKFRSKHGREFDDYYSYLECMNVLAIEGSSEEQIKHSLRRIWRLFKENTRNPVLVDLPRIVFLIPKEFHSAAWISSIVKEDNLSVCSDIRDFITDFNFEDFVDLSLSRGYKYQLQDYLSIFLDILE